MFKLYLNNDPYTCDHLAECIIENDAFKDVNDLINILDNWFIPEWHKTEFYATSGPDQWGIIDGYHQKMFTIVVSEYKLIDGAEKCIGSSQLYFYIEDDDAAKAFLRNPIKRYLEGCHR